MSEKRARNVSPTSAASRVSKSAASQGKSSSKKRVSSESDDFVSVARRLGADEDKERFEAKLKKIARAKPKSK